ncbi:MAG: hypothetical protein M1833_002835 [Piccolia ochrophora]|nr:MAG: hypothetical protein M1833_002835 [Piccolia ochrophora]
MSYPPGQQQMFGQFPVSSPAPLGQSNQFSPLGHENQVFDLEEWRVAHESCLRFFLDIAQHDAAVQVLCSFLNISLPCQRQPYPIRNFTPFPSSARGTTGGASRRSPYPVPSAPGTATQSVWVSLIPYIRRLIVTGYDYPHIVQQFFGPEWVKGVAPSREVERRHYLFAVKAMKFAEVKQHYDMGPHETVPYLKEPAGITEAELANAEDPCWGEWCALRDWQIGPRAP